MVEVAVNELSSRNLVLQKIKSGKMITDDEVHAIYAAHGCRVWMQFWHTKKVQIRKLSLSINSHFLTLFNVKGDIYSAHNL